MGRVTGHIRRVPRKRGDVWYMRYRLPSGHQEQKALGLAWDKRTKPPEGYYRERDAEDALAEKLAEIRRGEIPDPGARSGRTFGDARDEWLRYCRDDRGLEESTLLDYRQVSTGALTEEFGADTPLEAIDEARVEAFRSKMLSGELRQRHIGAKEQKALSRRSAQKRMVMLGGIMKRAKKLKWIPVDPTADVEAITLKSSGDFNVLSIEQVELVARSCDDEMFAAAIIVAAFTGLRTGELRALQWRDIDFAAASIHIRTNKPVGGEEKAPKSDQIRSVPLMDDAARVLDQLSRRADFTQPDDRVFPNEVGTLLSDDALRDALYDAMKAAGIDRTAFPVKPGFRFHDLRHTFGTLAVQVWPLSDVQAYMGHADIQTTMRYVHHIPKTTAAREFTEAVQRMREATAQFNPDTSSPAPQEHQHHG